MFKKFGLKFQITAIILVPIIVIIILANTFIMLYVGKITKNLSYKILEETSLREANDIKFNIQKHLYSVLDLKVNIENLYNRGI